MREGIQGVLTNTVRDSQTAQVQESGNIEVFSTPSLVALVEKACWMSIDQFLEEGQTTVGTAMDIKHLRATPVGMQVVAHTKLESVEGKKLTFHFEVYDDVDLISEGRHERYIVEAKAFEDNTNDKLEKNTEMNVKDRLTRLKQNDSFLFLIEDPEERRVLTEREKKMRGDFIVDERQTIERKDLIESKDNLMDRADIDRRMDERY